MGSMGIEHNKVGLFILFIYIMRNTRNGKNKKKTKTRNFKKKRKTKSVRKGNEGRGVTPEEVKMSGSDFKRPDSNEARRKMKADAEDYLDEFWSSEIDRTSAMHQYRNDQKKHEDKIRAEQRQALSTPFNISAFQVHRKKNPSPKAVVSEKLKKKKTSKTRKIKIPRNELRNEREGEMSPRSWDLFIEKLLQTPVPETNVKVEKEPLTPLELRFKRQNTPEMLESFAEAKQMMNDEKNK